MSSGVTPKPVVYYPDSDRDPLRGPVIPYDWASLLKWNVETYHPSRLGVFALDSELVYPSRSADTTIPSVVAVVLTRTTRFGQIRRAMSFYGCRGVEALLFVYSHLPRPPEIFARVGGRLRVVKRLHGYVIPQLGFRFARSEGLLKLYGPDGRELRQPAGDPDAV